MREIVRDTNAQPVENLCTNPSFERVVPGGTVVRRNLATNPSFERAVEGTTVVRRNLYPYPTTTPTGQLTFVGAGSGGSVFERSTRSHSGGIAVRAITSSGSRGLQPAGANANLTVTPGRTYTISLWLYVEGSTSLPGWQVGRSGYGSATAMRVDPTTPAGPDRWYRVYLTLTALPGDTFILPWFTTSDTSMVVHADDILFEERPRLLPAFRGDTPNDRGIAYEWEGAANASPSVAKAAVVEVRRNLSPNPSAQGASVWQTILPGNVGGAISRTTAEGRSDSFSFAYTAGAAVGNDKGPQVSLGSLAVGTVYTVSAYVKASSLFTPSGMRAGVYATVGGWQGTTSWSQVVGSWVRLHLTFTATGGNAAFVIGAPGVSTAGADLLVDDILVEATPALGDYFDGATTPDADLTPAWSGADSASPSVLYGTRMPGVGSNTPAPVWQSRAADGSARAAYIANGGYFQIDPYTPAVRTYTHAITMTAGATGTYTLWAIVNTALGVTPVELQRRSVTAGATVDFRGKYDLPVGAVNVRLWVGTPSAGVHYFSRALIAPGDDRAPVFTGDTIDNTGIAYSWESTAHESQSLARASVAEVRRNLFPDPQCASTTGWSVQNSGGGASALTSETGSTPVGSTFIRSTITAEPGSWARIQRSTGGIVAGLTYSRSIWMRASISGRTLELRGQWADSTGANLGEVPGSATVSSVAGEWHRLEAVGVAPAGAATLRVLIDSRNTGSAAGTTFDVAGGLVEQSTGVGAFFSGVSSPDPDLIPAWTSAENNSASILQGVRANQVIVTSSQTTGYLSSDQPERGASVFRSVLNTTSNAAIAVGDGSLLGSLVEGRIYTILMRARANTRPTQVRPRIRNSDLGTPGNIILPVGVWTTFRLTVAAGSGTAAQTGLLVVTASSGSHQIGDVIDVDRVTIVEGEHQGPYIDGDIPGCIWRGTPHASTSIGYPHLVALQAA